MPLESEIELAECLNIKAAWGTASTNDELKVLVQEYVKTNKDNDTEIGRHLQKHCRFKDCMPGDEWVASFMKKYDLSRKKPSALEKN